MPSLKYLGRAVADTADLSYRDYTDQVKEADLDAGEVDAAITSGLSTYATKAYVDAQDLLNATQTYIQNQDNLRVKTVHKDAASGVVALDSAGKINAGRITVPSTQKYPRGPWTPATVNASEIYVTGTETTLFTCDIVNPPSYPYKLLVYGMLDGRSDVNGEYPSITVRAGSAGGEIIASGLGTNETTEVAQPTTPVDGDTFDVNGPTLGDLWDITAVSGTAGSHYEVTDGFANWVGGGNAVRHYRRLGPDSVLSTDYPKGRMTLNGPPSNNFGGSQGVGQMRVRMNATETDWVGFNIVSNSLVMKYSVGGVSATMTGGSWASSPTNGVVALTPAVGDVFDILCGNVSSPYRFAFFRNGVQIGTAFDGGSVTQLGSNHRTWGFAAAEIPATFSVDPAWPPDLREVLVADAPPYYPPVVIAPVNLNTATTRTGATTLYVRGHRVGTNGAAFSTYRPRIWVQAVPA